MPLLIISRCIAFSLSFTSFCLSQERPFSLEGLLTQQELRDQVNDAHRAMNEAVDLEDDVFAKVIELQHHKLSQFFSKLFLQKRDVSQEEQDRVFHYYWIHTLTIGLASERDLDDQVSRTPIVLNILSRLLTDNKDQRSDKLSIFSEYGGFLLSGIEPYHVSVHGRNIDYLLNVLTHTHPDGSQIFGELLGFLDQVYRQDFKVKVVWEDLDESVRYFKNQVEKKYKSIFNNLLNKKDAQLCDIFLDIVFKWTSEDFKSIDHLDATSESNWLTLLELIIKNNEHMWFDLGLDSPDVDLDVLGKTFHLKSHFKDPCMIDLSDLLDQLEGRYQRGVIDKSTYKHMFTLLEGIELGHKLLKKLSSTYLLSALQRQDYTYLLKTIYELNTRYKSYMRGTYSFECLFLNNETNVLKQACALRSLDFVNLILLNVRSDFILISNRKAHYVHRLLKGLDVEKGFLSYDEEVDVVAGVSKMLHSKKMRHSMIESLLLSHDSNKQTPLALALQLGYIQIFDVFRAYLMTRSQYYQQDHMDEGQSFYELCQEGLNVRAKNLSDEKLTSFQLRFLNSYTKQRYRENIQKVQNFLKTIEQANERSKDADHYSSGDFERDLMELSRSLQENSIKMIFDKLSLLDQLQVVQELMRKYTQRLFTASVDIDFSSYFDLVSQTFGANVSGFEDETARVFFLRLYEDVYTCRDVNKPLSQSKIDSILDMY